MKKSDIRDRILAKRVNLDKTFVENASEKIYQRLSKTEEFCNAKTIMFYVSKDNEVSTHSMIKNAIDAGKKICVPYTDRINHTICPVIIEDMEKDLAPGAFGILEPKEKKESHTILIDLIITPGIAFDENGYRLGWGKGYYDRFLEKLNRIPRIGLAYDFQIVKELPRDKHDVPVDMVITEKRIIKRQ